MCAYVFVCLCLSYMCVFAFIYMCVVLMYAQGYLKFLENGTKDSFVMVQNLPEVIHSYFHNMHSVDILKLSYPWI